MAKVICQYTDKLPMQCRAQADQILLGAAEAGMGQDGIARLAAEMYERSRSGQPDDDGPDGDSDGDSGDGRDDGFEDRGLTLAITFRGAGVLTGDLTPECAALAGTVLESLGRRAGPEDTRTHDQRLHDALEEALAGHGRSQPGRCHPAEPQTQPPGTEPTGAGTPQCQAPGGPLTANAREILQRAVIGAAADLLSGPGGLASYLRTRQLGGGLAGPSLPLDVGVTGTVPAAVRHALVVRSGGHCEWPGGCDQPAGACHVHHLTRRADGGKTSVKDCGLYCSFHHLIAVHRWGWTLTLNPDGTTTARSPDGSKTLRSHGPPPHPG